MLQTYVGFVNQQRNLLLSINMKRIYLDYAAATPVDPVVKQVMDEYLQDGSANPSGLYHEGRESKSALENARKIIAGFIGAKSNEVIFTSSTTESNNLAILGAARANGQFGHHLITTATDHVSVLNVFKQLETEGFEVSYLPVDEYGRVSPEQVSRSIRPDTILVSVIFASNEIGTISPIKEIGKKIEVLRQAQDKPAGLGLPYFHTDAAQAAPHIKINVHNLGLDLMSFSSSKIYGPKGAAALYIKHGVKISPVMLGGSQENGLRPGTQDVAGVVGFGKAIQVLIEKQKEEDDRLTLWRDKIVKEVKSALPEVLLNGHPQKRLANNISFAILTVKAEELVAAMDLAGFALSTRSACDAKNPTPPHVIKAIGRADNEAWGTVRITLGRYTTAEDVDAFIKIFITEINKLKKHAQTH